MRALAALTVQALTQQKLTFSKSDSETNLIASLPLLFQEIVRNCSGQNGRRQWTASELARWLPSQRDPIPETPAAAVRLPRSKSRRRKLTFYAIVFALGLVLLGTVGAFLRPILRNGTAEPVSSAAPSSVKPVEQTPIASASTVARKQPIEKPRAPAPPPERAHSEEATQSPVAGQVLPEITDKARSTIHGTVVIMVRVDVDQSGEVADAVLQTKRSPFLGRMSLAAARQWKFPAANEEAPRRWLVRFEITRTDTKASSTRVLATKTAEKSVEP
jgi:hypothetical protein